MFTVRNVGGASLFLFGTTFLWLTRMFASRGVTATGAAWAICDVLSYVSIAGFTLATWGLFNRTSWWETVAVVSAVVGTAALGPYWLAARHAGEVNPAFNVFVHLVGAAGVLVLLLVPALEQWVDEHVMT